VNIKSSDLSLYVPFDSFCSIRRNALYFTETFMQFIDKPFVRLFFDQNNKLIIFDFCEAGTDSSVLEIVQSRKQGKINISKFPSVFSIELETGRYQLIRIKVLFENEEKEFWAIDLKPQPVKASTKKSFPAQKFTIRKSDIKIEKRRCIISFSERVLAAYKNIEFVEAADKSACFLCFYRHEHVVQPDPFIFAPDVLKYVTGKWTLRFIQEINDGVRYQIEKS
jgi:hypothetical protein